LFTKNEQMVIKYDHVSGQENIPDKTVPIEDIGIVVLEHEQITISHPLLDKLIQNNAAIVSCNDKKHPTGMFLNLDGHTIQTERFKAQIEATEPLRKQLWQQTVKAKVSNQAAVLNTWKVDSGYLEEIARNIRWAIAITMKQEQLYITGKDSSLLLGTFIESGMALPLIICSTMDTAF
jgi:CRISPR-associated protein Cas1